jgi:hypothetical protein
MMPGVREKIVHQLFTVLHPNREPDRPRSGKSSRPPFPALPSGMSELGLNVRAQGDGAWRFLSEGFAAIPTPRKPSSWDGCRTIADAHDTFELARHARLLETLQVAALDRDLAWVGGDPLRDDWRSFRPLALGREEGWSDWLAHLLAGDREFLRRLFGIPELPGPAPEIHREEELLLDQADRSRGKYRSDIIIEWTELQLGIHLEVKLGDPHLEKTWAEARHLRLTHGGVWYHFLLVLPDQKREAGRIKEAKEAPAGTWPTVTVMTWEDVEREVREALLRPATPGSWRGMARGFAGALGQLKLRRPVLGLMERASDGV